MLFVQNFEKVNSYLSDIKAQLSKFFDSNKEGGYLKLNEVSENLMEFNLGFQKLSLVWSPTDYGIYFQTYLWHYDPNFITRYRKEPITHMDVLATDRNGDVYFINQNDSDRTLTTTFDAFIPAYFKSLELYINRYLLDKHQKVEKMLK